MTATTVLKKDDFKSDQTVRWCPGCGDYAILSAIQATMPKMGVPKEKMVFISGIGCSSRFPYYMNTYGFHTIHGRAPSIATGLKIVQPDLQIWMITGDGDGLSIGGNHLLHVLRRNPDINILLFNNRIYGLTKGQYSPTSEQGKKTKSSPMGSIDAPINPLRFALAAEASFVARTYDTNLQHMGEVFQAAAEHKGTSFIEIYQNCVIFNKDAFNDVYDRENRDDHMIHLEDGKPLVFGAAERRGIFLEGLEPVIRPITEANQAQVVQHSSTLESRSYANMLAEMDHPEFPVPVGVFRRVNRPVYEETLHQQVNAAVAKQGVGQLGDLFGEGDNTWEIT